LAQLAAAIADKDWKAQLTANTSVATVYGNHRQWRKAASYHERGLTCAIQLGDSLSQVTCMYDVVMSYHRLGHSRLEREWRIKCQLLANDIDNNAILASLALLEAEESFRQQVTIISKNHLI
jgi:hypothetical protein